MQLTKNARDTKNRDSLHVPFCLYYMFVKSAVPKRKIVKKRPLATFGFHDCDLHSQKN